MTDEKDVVVYDEGEGDDKAIIEKINDKLNRELADPKVMSALVATTFNGMDATRAKQALMEGMIRGFSFEDFLHKDVYAIPYGQAYSLITSIAHARKVGMRSGVIGKGAPIYTYKDEAKTKIDECQITIKRLVNGHIGEFTASVDFSEYDTGQNLWKKKPKTMIAKVAEMHALRMACPEETAQMYAEEEMQKEVQQPNRYKQATTDAKSLKMGALNNEKENNEEKEDRKNEARQASSGDESQEDNEQPPD